MIKLPPYISSVAVGHICLHFPHFHHDSPQLTARGSCSANISCTNGQNGEGMSESACPFEAATRRQLLRKHRFLMTSFLHHSHGPTVIPYFLRSQIRPFLQGRALSTEPTEILTVDFPAHQKASGACGKRGAEEPTPGLGSGAKPQSRLSVRSSGVPGSLCHQLPHIVPSKR